ncbi:MAG: DUF1289 domain-containing protein [Pseudomonadota bacterium]|nr:DUF1289 domain-containing protein [Pseudomonadota bacterium]
MKRPKSPCLSICNFSGTKGWCVGCGRTKLESQKWASMKPYDQSRIENDLKRRLTKIRAEMETEI